jgi:hypothetical protein
MNNLLQKRQNIINPQNFPSGSLEDLCRKIKSYLHSAESSILVMNNITRSLQLFGKEGMLEHLKIKINDHSALDAIAKRSHFHGNGFYKVVLEDNEDFRIRLHIWTPENNSEENLHNHRWHFASTILSGSLVSEIWEESFSSLDKCYDEYLYYGIHNNEEEQHSSLGKARVIRKETHTHVAGDAYNLFPHVMHRIIGTGRQLTSTLTCHPASSKVWARTISISGLAPSNVQRFLNAKELKNIFLHYIDELSIK